MKQEEAEAKLLKKVMNLHIRISSLPSLYPSKDVDTLFSQLVLACIPPSTIKISTLPPSLSSMRRDLIRLCASAEFLLESRFSGLLSSFPHPLHRLHLFPYFSNYLKLAALESTLLNNHCPMNPPTRLAFVGSGPLPMTSIILASYHFSKAMFHNYDIDPLANSMARRLVEDDRDLSSRMLFHDGDIMTVTHQLTQFQVVMLAALVGAEAEKSKVVEHLGNHMAPGAVLMLRSAHGARAFLYPIIDPSEVRGFEILCVYHPNDEVINSVIVARKPNKNSDGNPSPTLLEHGMGCCSVPLTCKCSERFAHKNVMEELTIEE